MTGEITLAGAVKDGQKFKADYDAIVSKISANRELCRLLVKSGHGTEAEKAEVAKLYPARKTKEKAPAAT